MEREPVPPAAAGQALSDPAPARAKFWEQSEAAQKLFKAIQEHIARGDKAKEKSEQHYIAAGQHLKTLKKFSSNWAEWEMLLKEQVKLSTGRASELIQIADGRKTVEQVRADTAKRVMKHSKKSSLANEEKSPLRNGEDPDVERDRKTCIALYQKVTEAEREAEIAIAEQPAKPIAEPVEEDDEAPLTNADRKKQFLLLAAGAIEYALTLFTLDIKPDAGILEAARRASEEWTKLAELLANQCKIRHRKKKAPLRNGENSTTQSTDDVLTVEDDLERDEYREAFLLRTADAMAFAVYSGNVDKGSLGSSQACGG
jgi:hypothetical protein